MNILLVFFVCFEREIVMKKNPIDTSFYFIRNILLVFINLISNEISSYGTNYINRKVNNIRSLVKTEIFFILREIREVIINILSV